MNKILVIKVTYNDLQHLLVLLLFMCKSKFLQKSDGISEKVLYKSSVGSIKAL